MRQAKLNLTVMDPVGENIQVLFTSIIVMQPDITAKRVIGMPVHRVMLCLSKI